MTDIELMKQALVVLSCVCEESCDALHHAKRDRHNIGEPCPVYARIRETVAALQDRLAQPQQKPAAWLDSDGFPWSIEGVQWRSIPDTYRPLYLVEGEGA